MGRQATDDIKLPRAHLSVFTWVALAAMVLVIVTLVVWAVWFAQPTIMR